MKFNNFTKPLKIQGAIGLIAVVVFTFWGSFESSLYGFFVGIVNVALLGLTFSKANKEAAESPQTGILILYMSAVARFVLLGVLFVVGLSLFGLEAMPVVVTFVVMQLGQAFNLMGKRRLTD